MIKCGLLLDLQQTVGAEGRGDFETESFPIQIAQNISMRMANDVLS